MRLQTLLEELQNRPGTGETIAVINPATEEQIAEFTDCGAEAVNDAVAQAKASFEAGVWAELPGRERAKIMWKIADLIDQYADELAHLDALNTGMPLTNNISRAHRLGKRLQAGTVSINCQLVFDHAVPFGGYKQSGWGHEHGYEGIEA